MDERYVSVTTHGTSGAEGAFKLHGLMDVDRILLKKVSEVSFSRSGHRLRCSFWKRITGKEPKGVTPDLNAVTRETQYKTAQTQGEKPRAQLTSTGTGGVRRGSNVPGEWLEETFSVFTLQY